MRLLCRAYDVSWTNNVEHECQPENNRDSPSLLETTKDYELYNRTKLTKNKWFAVHAERPQKPLS